VSSFFSSFGCCCCVIVELTCIYDQICTVDLGLGDNMLVGTFPPEIDSLQFLHSLDLSNNKLGGELPEVFLRLVALSKL
jgi:hypothetical protein